MLRPASNFSTPTTWAKSEIISTKYPALTLRNQPRAECIWMLSISTLYSGAVSVWSGYLTETLRQFWELVRAESKSNDEWGTKVRRHRSVLWQGILRLSLDLAGPGVELQPRDQALRDLPCDTQYLTAHFITLMHKILTRSITAKYLCPKYFFLMKLVKYFLLEWFPVPRIKYFLTRGGIVWLSYFMRPPPRISGFIVIPFLFLTIY